MSPQNKPKKMIIKIPRHPFIMAQDELNYEERFKVRNCRVKLERIKGQQPAGGPKRCCVRVARLPNDNRSELSVTPASSRRCSDFDTGSDSA